MDVISFIEKDIIRGQKKLPIFAFFFCAVTLLFPAVCGLLLRDDNIGVYEPRVLIPNMMAALLLILFPYFYDRRTSFGKRALVSVLVGLALALFLSTERAFFPPFERTVYASSQIFWMESRLCFLKGGLTVAIMGGYLSYFVFGASSWPSRRWRFLASLVSAVSGAIMLGFHCDSSSFEHIIIGHIGPGILVGFIVFIVQDLIFVFKLKNNFPNLSKKMSRLTKIG
jgi:hypothetical protein